MRRASSFVVVSLWLASFAGAGCSKKVESHEAPTARPVASPSGALAKPAEVPAGTADAASPETAPAALASAGPAKYAAGGVFAHLPKECPASRIFVDSGALLGSGGVSESALAVLLKLAAMSDPEHAKAKRDRVTGALKGLREGGINLARDVREVAVCGDDADDTVVALGMNTSGANAIDLLAKALTSATGEAPKEETEAGLRFLLKDGKAMAFVTPTVLVVAKDKARVLALRKAGDSPAAFGASRGHLAYALTGKGSDAVEIQVDKKGESLESKVLLAKSGGDPNAAKLALERTLKGLAAKLRGSPLRLLGDHLEKAKVTAEGARLAVTASVPIADLVKLLGGAAQANERELTKLLR